MWDDNDPYEMNAMLHRTLIEFLIQSRHPEIAAAILDGWVDRIYVDGKLHFFVEIPPAGYTFIAASEDDQAILRRALREITGGHHSGDAEIVLRMKLLPAPDVSWNKNMKALIAQFKGSNQGLISELCAAREGRPIHTWNEMKYASKSEIAIAQELEKRKILFFPLAVAVRAETGQRWQDHREVDFLICNNGVWGILEVAYHPDRYEKDAERDHWFKISGILCIQHYTAERSFREAPKVVEEFLGILKQFQK